MKIYSGLLVIALLVPVSAKVPNRRKFDSFEKAIEETNFGRVETLLKRHERNNTLSPSEKKAMFDRLYDQAADVVDERTQRVSRIKNISDLSKTIFGGIFTLSGLGFLVYHFSAKHMNDLEEGYEFLGPISLAPGAAFTSLGLYLGYKGLTCSAQRSKIAEAKKIEELLDNIEFEVEVPVEES